MTSITLSVPEELKKRMEKHPEVKWSEVVRSILRQQLDEWEELEKIASKSRLTQKDAKELSRKVDEEMAKHFEGLGRAPRH
ncbi:MAG: hypothetical protein HY393_00400 [Candidatus Diapherotrites archaeon]|nr:hypothetical protein [Candidatus Diapherotrites archaeon]